MSNAEPLTAAGLKMLRSFAERESAGRLCALVDGRGQPTDPGMPLPGGDGGALAASQRLSRQGLVRLVGRRHRRFVQITEAGRAALAQQG